MVTIVHELTVRVNRHSGSETQPPQCPFAHVLTERRRGLVLIVAVFQKAHREQMMLKWKFPAVHHQITSLFSMSI